MKKITFSIFYLFDNQEYVQKDNVKKLQMT